MSKFLHFKLLMVSAIMVISKSAVLAQVDTDASEKTVTLYSNLKYIQNSSQFFFGQEFFNSFRFSSGGAHGEKEYSDSKTVTGSHPAVLGSDFHYYLEKDATERSYHTEAVKWAYQQGYIITFDWHLSGKGTTTYEYQVATKDLVNNIVADLNGDRAWYYNELDKVIDIINNDLVVGTEKIPIVFRPLHEMNGGWFWWGSQATTPANYIALYKLLVNYVKERTNSVLFCWSPNTPTNFGYYPGDDYVDVLGVDAYEVNSSIRAQLAPIVDHAQANNKVAVFSETGYRSNPGTTAGDNARSAYWKNTILPAILDDPTKKSQKIAWVLTWINASWSVPYVPHSNSTQEAKQSFIEFKNSPYVIFGDEMPDMYSTIPIVAVADNARGIIADLQLYPIPVKDRLTITLSGFENSSRISIYDVQGKLIHELGTTGEETLFYANEVLSSGMYVLKVSDSKKTISKKLLVN